MTNHYPWLQHCIEKEYIKYLNTSDLQQDVILWDGLASNEEIAFILKDAADNFNIAHGITIIKREDAYIEHFNFATTVNNPEITNFYMSSMELLERFIIYFRDKAKKLIQIAEGYAVNLKDIALIKRTVNQQDFYRHIDCFITHMSHYIISVFLILYPQNETTYILVNNGRNLRIS